jgi:hypothetical protein
MDSTSEKASSIFDSLKTNNFEADINSAESLTGYQKDYGLSTIPWYFWLMLVLVLAFFGFNIFVYLAKGTDDISNFFGPIIEKIGSFFGVALVNTTNQTASVAVTGANAIATSVGATQGASVANLKPLTDAAQNSTLYTILNSVSPEANKTIKAVSNPSDNDEEYAADDSHSSIQQSKSSNKSGWCYIGEDRGFRTCTQVSEKDTCMSGSIFPSQDICINPSLRA